MHELSLSRQLFGVVARAAGGRPVLAVQVRVGHLRQVVPASLEHAWGFTVRGTALEGSRLEMEEVAVRLYCGSCHQVLPPPAPLVFSCAACGSARTRVVAGEEFQVVSIDVSDAPSP